MKKSLKENAIELRKLGNSYKIISEKLGLSKSTLSDWLREVPYNPNEIVLDRIRVAQLKSALFKQEQRRKDIIEKKKIAKSEIGKINKRDLLMIGIGLYWGEGSKLNENIRIINSDPHIIKTSMVWFRKIFLLKDENFTPSVHLYPDSNVIDSINYWSKITQIPINQFGKTQIDKRVNKSRKKKGKLPYGTLHLQIKSCGKKDFGRSMHRKIIGYIEAICAQV